MIVEDTIRALIARHPTQSLVWLHDGFLVAPPPPEQLVRQIEKEVTMGDLLLPTNYMALAGD